MDDYSLSPIVETCSDTIKKVIKSSSYKSLEIAAQKFVRQSALRLKAGKWLYDVLPNEAYLSGEVGDFKILEEVKVSSLFTPFVEKHVFDPGSEVAVISDLHGDIHALLSILQELVALGYLDDQYQVIRDNFYIVFLGDYTNRGFFSVETMALLFHMHGLNIGKGLLLRGNHEYAVCNKHMYEYFSEIGKEEAGEQETLLSEFARKFEVYYYPDLLYWYDYLPLACYIGCKNSVSGVTNFATFCHAGIEVGFNPQQFLVTQGSRFDIISRLNRYNAMQKVLEEKTLESLRERIHNVFEYCKEKELHAFMQTYMKKGLIDFTNPQSPRRVRLGMQWNNFLTEQNDSIGFAASIARHNILFGRLLTQYFLDAWGTDNVHVKTVVRGHQHLNEHDEAIGLDNNMLDTLIAQKGCVRQWDGLVYTLGDSSMTTGYHTFLVMTLNDDVDKWSVQHFFKKAEKEKFDHTSYAMFGSEKK